MQGAPGGADSVMANDDGSASPPTLVTATRPGGSGATTTHVRSLQPHSPLLVTRPAQSTSLANDSQMTAAAGAEAAARTASASSARRVLMVEGRPGGASNWIGGRGGARKGPGKAQVEEAPSSSACLGGRGGWSACWAIERWEASKSEQQPRRELPRSDRGERRPPRSALPRCRWRSGASAPHRSAPPCSHMQLIVHVQHQADATSTPWQDCSSALAGHRRRCLAPPPCRAAVTLLS